ncbi:MAG: UxaA family hydrolase [Gammaproteobacteria bacterium]
MTTESPLNFATNPAAAVQSGAVKLHDDDNVAIVINGIARGEAVADFGITAKNAIPRGHKAAIMPINKGARIVKYGQTIGIASCDIRPGEHLHLHNVAMADIGRDYAFGKDAKKEHPPQRRDIFRGYKRPGEKTGTRNYIGIASSVNCSATAARLIAQEAQNRGMLKPYPQIDGIVPVVHGAGCGVGTNDEAFYKLQRAIWGHVAHPNFAAVLMIGLGCEANQIPMMLEKYGTPQNFHHLIMQQQGGTAKTIEQGLQWLAKMLPQAAQCKREDIPASELKVALQCGGSDGFSGITANPALGFAADRIVENGGCAVLAETPEIYGAEHLLAGRAASKEVGEKLIALIRWWEEYAAKHGGAMNNNPTPGNKAGGLTTILEKSLGAAAKGGTTNLAGVYAYGEMIKTRGLIFMDSPGYDPVSVSGQVAAGCNVVCFTTGRGSCYGNKPSPTIKIASNTPMFDKMRGDMDVNCGTIAEGTETASKAGMRIFDEILQVASGKKTLSEKLGVGDLEFAPWQTYAQM